MPNHELPIEAKRLKLIRVELGLTQFNMAKSLGTTQSIADMERGRIRIPGNIVTCLFDKYNVNPKWLYGLSEQKFLLISTPDVSPKTVAIDTDGKENIILVSSKAYAGYTDNLHNVEWFKDLPAFNIPLPQFSNESYRSFQISGDSMTGIIEDGEWALAQALERVEDITNGGIYIVVGSEGILCKSVFWHSKDNRFSLVSNNPEYDLILMKGDEINEIWEVKGKICPNIHLYSNHTQSTSLLREISNIKSQLQDIKNQL